MGLDMYLTGKIRVGANYEHNNVSGVVYITKNGKEIDIPLKKITDICIDLGYWRKANAIHAYFVDNISGGLDECQEMYLDRSDLIDLLDKCSQVMANKDKASEILPTKSGFFFGDTEYNNGYFDDIQLTIDILQAALKYDNIGYYYQASW
jgi:hypothetical protein